MTIKKQGHKIYCFDPYIRKYVLMGSLINDVYVKSVTSKNFMKVVNGYGIQYDAFRSLVDDYKIKQVQILEPIGRRWISKPKDWDNNGHIADYGRGKQVFLSLKYMKKAGP